MDISAILKITDKGESPAMANILAVDDEKAVLTLIKNILQMDHHVVTTVSDPEKIFNLQLGVST